MRTYTRAGSPFDDSTTIGDGMTLAIALHTPPATYSPTQPTDTAVRPAGTKPVQPRLSAEDIALLREENLTGIPPYVVDLGNDPIAAYDCSGLRHGSIGTRIREYTPILPK